MTRNFGLCTATVSPVFDRQLPSVEYVAALCKQGQLQQALDTVDYLKSEGFRLGDNTYESLLRACNNSKSLEEAKRVHAHIMNTEYEQQMGEGIVIVYGKCESLEDAKTSFDKLLSQSVVCWNAMITAYAKGGCLEMACRMLINMPGRNVVSWNAMMAAYIKHGQIERAMELLSQMLIEGIQPNRVTFMSILNACIGPDSLAEGKRIHEYVTNNGLELDVVVGTSLINMYCSCASLDEARRVFDRMHERNEVTWNSMIAASAKLGGIVEAVQLFHGMSSGGLKPNMITFVTVLNACATHSALPEGKLIHGCIPKGLLESDVILGTALINMYCKCGSLKGAKDVFEKMHEWDMVSCNAMLSTYACYGKTREAFNLFQQMYQRGFIPDKFTFSIVLTACTSSAVLVKGKIIHAMILERRFDSHNVVSTALVRMYTNCGSVNDARKAFDKIPESDVISWTALIKAYAQHGDSREAFQLYRQMYNVGIGPNLITFTIALGGCASLAEGKLLHCCILISKHDPDLIVDTALIHMYLKYGSLEDARAVFDRMPERNEVAWTGIAAAYGEHGNFYEAFHLFQKMSQEGVKSNSVAFYASLLNACGNSVALEEGKLVHAHILESKLKIDCVLGTALVNMYSKCGNLVQAREMFDQMPIRNVCSWTVMVEAYTQHGYGKIALQLFQEMRREGVKANKITFLSALNACTSLVALAQGRLIHSQIIDSGFGDDILVGTALVKMYSKCGSLDKAWEVFENLSKQDVVSWTAMIAAYVRHGNGKMAIQLFQDMYKSGIMPDKVAFLSSLTACISSSALNDGKLIHACMLYSGIVVDALIGTGLITMYMKCGCLDDALRAFTELPERNVILWNTLVGAYASIGDVENTVFLFQQMLEEGVQPDKATYVNLHHACSQAVLIGKCYWGSASSPAPGTTPIRKHYIHIVNLLRQARLLCEAKDFLNRIPCENDSLI